MPLLTTQPHAAPRPVRVIDTGLRGGRENVALDQALIEARNAGRMPRHDPLPALSPVRARRAAPDAVARGAARLLRAARHRGGPAHHRRRRPVPRRRPDRLGAGARAARRSARTSPRSAARICAAAAAGLQRLGVPAEFRPRNDIEVDGRKLCGTGGVVDGDTLFFQGTLLVDFDPARMIEVLRIPVDKLARRDLEDARRRVVSLARAARARAAARGSLRAALLAGFREHLGLEPAWGESSEYEERLARRLLEEQYGTDEFVRSLDAPAESAPLCRRRWCAAAARCARTSGSKAGRTTASARRWSRAISSSARRAPCSTWRRACAASPAAEAGAAVEAFFAQRAMPAPRPRARRLPRRGGERARAAVVQRGRAAAARPLARRAAGAGADARVPARRAGQRAPVARLSRPAGEGHRLRRAALRPLGLGRLRSARAARTRSDYLLRRGARRAARGAGAQRACARRSWSGQSDGASIALAYAGAHPERVLGVIALSPHLFVEARTRAQIRPADPRLRARRPEGAAATPPWREHRGTVRAAGRGVDGHGARRGLGPGAPGRARALPGARDPGRGRRVLHRGAARRPRRACCPGASKRCAFRARAHYPLHQARNEVLAASIRLIRAAAPSRPFVCA